MQTEEQLKEIVRKKYSEIALQDKETNMSSCCGAGGCSTEVYNIMSEDYTTLKGYNADADLGLGCGLPTQYAQIKKGDVVVDLGSGAGNDCFIARHETGETGKVIGVDFTPAMIDKARSNAEVRGFNNVEFRQGDIESMPITANTADVIVSNCVLNLVPNKDAVIKDIYRVLKPGGHFSISDVVLVGANTARLENYRQPKAREEFAFLNRKPPRLAVVSSSLDFDLAAPLFHGGQERTIVFNAGTKTPTPELLKIAQVIQLPADDTSSLASNLIARLFELGLRKVTCEGGPSLLTQLLAVDAIY